MVTENQMFIAVNNLARGLTYADALRSSRAYTEKCCKLAAGRLFSGARFRAAIQRYANGLFDGTRDESRIAEQLALIRQGTAHISKLRAALHSVWVAFNGGVEMTAVELASLRGGIKVKKRKARIRTAEALTPQIQAELHRLREMAKAIKPGDIGGMATARLAEELITPPEDGRTRVQVMRLGLERDGLIGANPAALHLHKHEYRPPFEHLPIVVQKLLLGKSLELVNLKRIEDGLPALQELPIEIAAELVTPDAIDTEPCVAIESTNDEGK